jgi:quaternary ammonium compound-resistance protein SugE
VAIAWAYLIAAGLCEIGWPIGLKWTQEPGWTVVGTAMAVVSLAISGGLLFLAQRDISLGTSYAVWTGIGAAGTFLVGVWFFGDPSSLGRWLGASLIIAGTERPARVVGGARMTFATFAAMGRRLFRCALRHASLPD